MQIIYPWPRAILSPNARAHWAAVARQKKLYRYEWHMLTLQAKVPKIEHQDKVLLDILFVPPDRRARDLDNMMASIKSGLDGLADALDANDRRFRYGLVDIADSIGGMVKVTIY